MTVAFREQVEIITRLAKVDLDQAFTTVWRFAFDQGEAGWYRSLTSVIKVHTYGKRLLTRTGLLTRHRKQGLRLFVPVTREEWVSDAKRPTIEEFIKSVRYVFGADAALWQRGALNPAYPKICAMTVKDKDRLAQLNVMSPIAVAQMRG